MGNFSVNHYSAISVAGNRVQILFLVDMAEIPTFQELASLGGQGATDLRATQKSSYLANKLRGLAPEIALTSDRKRVPAA